MLVWMMTWFNKSVELNDVVSRNNEIFEYLIQLMSCIISSHYGDMKYEWWNSREVGCIGNFLLLVMIIWNLVLCVWIFVHVNCFHKAYEFWYWFYTWTHCLFICLSIPFVKCIRSSKHRSGDHNSLEYV